MQVRLRQSNKGHTTTWTREGVHLAMGLHWVLMCLKLFCMGWSSKFWMFHAEPAILQKSLAALLLTPVDMSIV